ncbi:MAG: Holliday junction resolvase RuvX [Acutalibacteraceae bacterium]
MIIMSVDWGKARTGIAICDITETLASPVANITEYNRERLIDKVSALAKERKVQLIVVGLPKNMDGTEGESAQNARLFAQSLTEVSGIETVMQDERGTTVTAHHFLNETNTRGKKRKNAVDSVAAVIILESYLSSRRRAKAAPLNER